MSDKPILFSGPMVRALLAGHKTQTRRALKKPKWAMPGYDFELETDGPYIVAAETGCTAKAPLRIAVGDRLYVRETWQGLSFGDYLPTKSKTCDLRFAATDTLASVGKDVRGYPWRPGIHMPRWASRLTLTVTNVRVERLHDISEQDARAEGVEPAPYSHWKCYGTTPKPFRGAAPTVLAHGLGVVSADAIHSYATLWDSINGEGAWEVNPWVAAYSFSVEQSNIDAVSAQ